MCGQDKVRASAEDNTGQNTDKDTQEIKIPDPAGNLTRVAGLEGRDSTDHATTTDKSHYSRVKSTSYFENNK